MMGRTKFKMSLFLGLAGMLVIGVSIAQGALSVEDPQAPRAHEEISVDEESESSG